MFTEATIRDFLETVCLCGQPKDFFFDKYDEETIFYVTSDNHFHELTILSGEWNGYKWKLNAGSTKIVFIFDELDIVLKANVSGLLYMDADCSEDYLGDFLVEDWRINYYYENYLYNETEIYDEAKGQMRKFLLPNTFVGRIGEIEFYTQPKVRTFEQVKYNDREYFDAAAKRAEDNIKEIADINSIFPCVFVNDILDYYGRDFDFETADELPDMREANFGYWLKNNKMVPVIMDFGGYSED